jgi:hypothetical protein
MELGRFTLSIAAGRHERAVEERRLTATPPRSRLALDAVMASVSPQEAQMAAASCALLRPLREHTAYRAAE